MTLTASVTDTVDYVFAGWSGGGCTGTDPCEIAGGDGAVGVTATFLRRYTISLGAQCVPSATIGGAGTITSIPAGIECSFDSGGFYTGDCVARFTSGTSVQLDVSVTSGTFTWCDGGANACNGALCSGSGSCTTIMNECKSQGANFGP